MTFTYNEKRAARKGFGDRNSKLFERVDVPVVARGMMIVFPTVGRCEPKSLTDRHSEICVLVITSSHRFLVARPSNSLGQVS
jgi:hypothetical protein